MIQAGSDVSNIKTVAKAAPGGGFVLNGMKKWITNAIWADYAVAAVRTGANGRAGISLLIVPLEVPGVTCRRMQNSGVHASGQ